MREHVRHLAGIPIEIVHNGGRDRYVLQNVSLGGIACYGDVSLPERTKVQVHMYLLKPAYSAHGHIIWCKQGEQGYELGIELSGEKDRARLHMIEQISHIEHYRNEVKLSEQRDIDGEQAAREWVATHVSDY